jgi:hypothetical protein
LTDPETPATILLVIFIDEFGTECLEWEPQTLQLEVEGTWGVKLPATNWDKLYAVFTALTTNTFERAAEGFIQICNGINGDNDFTNFTPATVEDMCLAVAEMSLIDPPEKGNFPFSPEVVAYINEKLKDEGFVQAPKLLSPYVKEYEPMEEPKLIEEEESLYKMHYNAQRERRAEIEGEAVTRLSDIIQRLQVTPLRYASKEKIADLKQNAGAILSGKLS